MADVPLSRHLEWPRWTIKPESLVATNGAEITMGIAYGPAPDEAVEVVPIAALAAVKETHDDVRQDIERQVAVMREAAARLRPLVRAATTDGGADGADARRDLREAIDWLARGCPGVRGEDAS